MFIIALLVGLAIGEIIFVEYLIERVKPNTKLSDKRLRDMEEGTIENKTFLSAVTDQIHDDLNDINNTIISVKTNVYYMLMPRRINALDILADDINRI